MIISRTPLRISFAGGGSDLPAFYRLEPGAVLSVAIDKYIYITVNKKFDHKIRVSYSVTEIVDAVSELKHELIREAMLMTGVDGGIEITSISDIPSQGTGLGSSSAYTVGVLNALYAFAGRYADPARLAREACEIELVRCGRPIGKQDQYSAAHGNLQFMRFQPDENVFVEPVICRPEVKPLLEARLLLMYTGLTRSADGILRDQQERTRSQESTRRGLRAMVQLAGQLREALQLGELDGVGEILHQDWIEKRRLADGITSPQIDAWYDCAREHGALGGKLLGAGGGGFLLLYTPAERQREIISALPQLRHVPFRFEPQGSRIIFVEESR